MYKYQVHAVLAALSLSCTRIDAFAPKGWSSHPSSTSEVRTCWGSAARSPRAPRRPHTTVPLLCSSQADKRLAREAFLKIARVGAITTVAGAVTDSDQARAAGANNKAPPKFIDVSVNLGSGMVLDVRQPYGLPKADTKSNEGGGDRQGTYVWPASTDLAKFLVSSSGRRITQGKRVVELGAGTAISGLAAAIAGASEVVFTDGSTEVLEVTLDTVQRNRELVNAASRIKPPCQLQVKRLRWGNGEDLAALLSRPLSNKIGGFDVVLGAEITYLSASIDPLFTSVQALLASSGLALTAGAGANEPAAGTSESPLDAQAQEKIAQAPVALLTFTPELTAFDGGGVKELERKAHAHGLVISYLAPPTDNPDPDTQIVALTLKQPP